MPNWWRRSRLRPSIPRRCARAWLRSPRRGRCASRSRPPGERVNIYIESNQHDTDLWLDLGERIKSKWEELVQQAGAPRVPPLSLEALGLPLQKIDEERLDDADGVVLLWGQKPEVSLRAQIKKVEGKWPRDPPPRIVAYLMPQQPDPGGKIEARLWSVLRFQDADSSKHRHLSVRGRPPAPFPEADSRAPHEAGCPPAAPRWRRAVA